MRISTITAIFINQSGRIEMYENDKREAATRGQVERRKQPFVPDRKRVVYTVDPAVSRAAALAKFHAEIRLIVGAQLTELGIERTCRLEDQIRERAHDETEYAELQHWRMGYLAAGIKVRDAYMGLDDLRPWQ
jgi:hypothetical protein